MVKKTWFISLLLAPIFASCQPSTFDKVVIPFSDELKTIDGQYQSLTEYNQLQLMVEQEETFI